MSSPAAEAFDPEAPEGTPKLKGKARAFEPFDQDPLDDPLAPKRPGDLSNNEGEFPDTLVSRIEHLQEGQEGEDVSGNTTSSRPNGFTFKRTVSTEHVQTIEELGDNGGQDAKGEINNGDLESDGGSQLPSPPGSVGIHDDTLSIQVY